MSSRATTTASRTRGCSREGGLDLAQLDAEAAELHLVVEPAEELDGAVGAAPGQVAGPVQARRAGVPPNGSGTNCSAVSSGRLEVAAARLHAADVQLAGDADRHRLAGARSSTYIWVLAIGRPIGTRPPARRRGWQAQAVTSTAASVGPYRLCSSRPGRG